MHSYPITKVLRESAREGEREGERGEREGEIGGGGERGGARGKQKQYLNGWKKGCVPMSGSSFIRDDIFSNLNESLVAYVIVLIIIYNR